MIIGVYFPTLHRLKCRNRFKMGKEGGAEVHSLSVPANTQLSVAQYTYSLAMQTNFFLGGRDKPLTIMLMPTNSRMVVLFHSS